MEENLLKDESLEILGKLQNLKYLYLSGNKIENIESLSFINELKNLKVLDLVNCPVSKDETNFAKILFERYP